MKNISTNKFWLLFSIFFIVLSLGFMDIIYNTQRAILNENFKNKLNIRVDLLNYALPMIVDKNRLEDYKSFIDNVAAIDPGIKRLLIVNPDEKKISLSSDKKHQNSTLLDQAVDIMDFQKMTNIEKVRLISFYIKALDKTLLIELDKGNINEFFDLEMNNILLEISGIFVIVLIALIFVLNRIFLSPIKQLKAKIDSNNLTQEEYCLADLTYLNQTIIQDFKIIDSKNILLDTVINTTDDLIFFKDKDLKYLGCNDAFCLFVGKSREEIIGRSDFELFPMDVAKLFRQMDTKIIQEKQNSTNFEWGTYPNGEKVYLQTKKNLFYYTKDEVGILGFSRDITEIYLIQKEIKAKTYIDELTKLSNRKSYNRRIDDILALYKRYSKTFSIMLYDIDDFKLINDTYGHTMGDQVLAEMSHLIKSLIRDSDYIFRTGGEEFIIIFPCTTISQAKNVAEKIRKTVESDLNLIENKKITISIGVTEVNKSDDVDTLFKRADDLMYYSKNNGKNRVSHTMS